MLRAILFVSCLLIATMGLIGSFLAVPRGDQSAMAAVFPPWWSPSRSFAAAGEAGDVVRGGAFPFVLIVTSGRPGLEARLRAAGALILLNPLDASGCVASPTASQKDV